MVRGALQCGIFSAQRQVINSINYVKTCIASSSCQWNHGCRIITLMVLGSSQQLGQYVFRPIDYVVKWWLKCSLFLLGYVFVESRLIWWKTCFYIVFYISSSVDYSRILADLIAWERSTAISISACLKYCEHKLSAHLSLSPLLDQIEAAVWSYIGLTYVLIMVIP